MKCPVALRSLTLGDEIDEMSTLRNGRPYLRNGKKTGCLGYMRDEILPSYMGIKISHYEESRPSQKKTSIPTVMEVWGDFFCFSH